MLMPPRPRPPILHVRCWLAAARRAASCIASCVAAQVTYERRWKISDSRGTQIVRNPGPMATPQVPSRYSYPRWRAPGASGVEQRSRMAVLGALNTQGLPADETLAGADKAAAGASGSSSGGCCMSGGTGSGRRRRRCAWPMGLCFSRKLHVC